MRSLSYILIGTVIIIAGYEIVGHTIGAVHPCSQPLQYSIGTFDPRFGESKSQFLAVVKQAASIWDKAAGGKDLFEYSPTGDLKINLVYDYRQQATVELQKIGVVIGSDRASYDALKAKYDSMLSSYDQQKTQLDSMIASYQAQKDSYEAEVADWNRRGGAPPDQYAKIEQERNALNSSADAVNNAETALNQLADTINAAVAALNEEAQALNLNAGAFNTVNASTGKQFDEGEYVSDATSTRIDVYQYADQDKLLRLMAHELGHSLGLQHVGDPKAIMYYLNEGVNEVPTSADITELGRVCGFK